MTDRIVTLLTQQREQQARDAVESVVKSLARVVFTIQLKELEIKVESDRAATEAEKTATARVLEDDTIATRLLSRRFGEEWRKEAMAAAEHSLADLRAECPKADISGDLAFFDGLEAAIALIHAKVKACNAKMLADATEQMRPAGPSAGHAAATAAKVVNELATGVIITPEPWPVRDPIVPQETLDKMNDMPSLGSIIPEPQDLREIRELGADPGDTDDGSDRRSDTADDFSEPF